MQRGRPRPRRSATAGALAATARGRPRQGRSTQTRCRQFRRARSLLAVLGFGDQPPQILELLLAELLVLQELREQRPQVIAEQPPQKRFDERLAHALSFDERRIEDRATAIRNALDRAFLFEAVD